MALDKISLLLRKNPDDMLAVGGEDIEVSLILDISYPVMILQ